MTKKARSKRIRKAGGVDGYDLLQQREQGYSDGLICGRKEGEKLGIERALTAVLALLPKESPKVEKVEPAPKAKDYPFVDVR